MMTRQTRSSAVIIGPGTRMTPETVPDPPSLHQNPTRPSTRTRCHFAGLLPRRGPDRQNPTSPRFEESRLPTAYRSDPEWMLCTPDPPGDMRIREANIRQGGCGIQIYVIYLFVTVCEGLAGPGRWASGTAGWVAQLVLSCG